MAPPKTKVQRDNARSFTDREDKRRRPDDVRVRYRKMSFAYESSGFDKHWHGGSAFITYFWNALSMAIPAGERFFIEAVNCVRDQIDDAELAAELNEFLRQEGHHSLQHAKLNRMVGEQGFDVERYQRRVSRPLELAAGRLSPIQKLAVTVALEHFTAVLARQILVNPTLTKNADPAVVELWRWHASEELEHKGTCFDLYERLGGTQRMRVKAMRAAWILELALALQSTFGMMRESGRLFDLPDLVRGFWHLFGPSGFVTSMVPGLIAYVRPDFHPWLLNDGPLIAAWLSGSAHATHTRRTPLRKRSGTPPGRGNPEVSERW
jgi:predicted metal-dependent hydrolase